MTTATETVPAVGTRVRITRAYPGGGANNGQTGTVVVNDNDCCSGSHRFTVRRDTDEAEVWAEQVEPIESEPRPFQAGDKVRLTRSIGGLRGNVGQVGTLEQHPSNASTLGFRPEGCTEGGGYGGGLYAMAGGPGGVGTYVELIEPAAEPTVASGDLADALARAEKAERDLQAFRDRVRERLIEEAERRDWCHEADDWLESLGLEGREPATETYDVYVDVKVRVCLSTEATNSDAAADQVDSYSIQDLLLSAVRDRDFTYEIDYVD